MRVALGVLILLDLIVVGYVYFIKNDISTGIFFLCAAIFLECMDIEEILKDKKDA